mmetsp:Transcript_50795/g.62235  ORF Transcript_50795/g.62235 Transcript_50795/m.62235 type:complete len:195 (+) Transcript_50795:78-662(+)
MFSLLILLYFYLLFYVYPDNDDDDDEGDSKDDEIKDNLPYDIVIVDKYGRSCGICDFTSSCNGCSLFRLKNTFQVPNAKYSGINFVIRWKNGSRNCFNHDAFVRPIKDDSLIDNNDTSNNYSNYSYNAMANDVKPIPLKDCFKLFTQKETLSEQNLWYCNKCKAHKPAKKKIRFMEYTRYINYSFKKIFTTWGI